MRSRTLVDDGKLIEAGWVSLRLASIPLDVLAVQLGEMRNAFFAGAQHLFGSTMTILDPGEEPTDADLERMSLIQDELNAFISSFTFRRRARREQPGSFQEFASGTMPIINFEAYRRAHAE